MRLLTPQPLLLSLAVLLIARVEAFAHASDRGFVLLLPTGHYIFGGALAVAASFAALVFLRPDALVGFAQARLNLFRLRFDPRMALSLFSFAVLAVLVIAGLTGSGDPLSNPLPLTIWTLFWVGLTLATGVFGNIFAWINPWYGPWRVVSGFGIAVSKNSQQTPLWPVGHLPFEGGDHMPYPLSPIANTAGSAHRPNPPISPLEGEMADRPEGGEKEPATNIGESKWSYLPAIIQFAAFAWFELVYPAPDDPSRFAWVVATYWLFNFVATLVFGYDRWTRTGECFSVFFRIVSKLGVVGRRGDRVYVNWPAAKLADVAPLPASAVIFVLAALASVSFDGLMRTFWWLEKTGVNPLEFPGRSAVILPNTLGLFAAITTLAVAFLCCVWLGEKMSGEPAGLSHAAGLLVWSIVPIALAYHFAHYLTSLLVNGQYALAAISDPFSLGWNLFGTADNYVSAGLVMGAHSAWVLWNLQAAAIVSGHVLAVVIAHTLAARLHREPRAAMRSQAPLTMLMIGYTVLGLWLLSTPTGA